MQRADWLADASYDLHLTAQFLCAEGICKEASAGRSHVQARQPAVRGRAGRAARDGQGKPLNAAFACPISAAARFVT